MYALRSLSVHSLMHSGKPFLSLKTDSMFDSVGFFSLFLNFADAYLIPVSIDDSTVKMMKDS